MSVQFAFHYSLVNPALFENFGAKLVYTCLNLPGFFQIKSKIIQIGLDLSKLVKKCLKLFKLVLNCQQVETKTSNKKIKIKVFTVSFSSRKAELYNNTLVLFFYLK